MKILFIHNRYKQHGGEDVVAELECNLLKEKGHEATTLLFDNKTIEGPFAKLGTALRSVYNFSSASKVARFIKAHKPDIIHIHNIFFVASPSVFFAARRSKIPVVVTLHNYRLICSNALLLRQNKICELCTGKKFPLYGIKYKCYKNSSAITALVTITTGIHKVMNTWKSKVNIFLAPNEFSRKKLLLSSLHIPEHQMITKPYFIPDPGESDISRKDFFFFAGRIVREKGVHILLRSFEKMPGQKLIIAGDGEERKILSEQYKNCTNIFFIGQVSKQEVLKYMKECKAFICPSIWYETGPMTVIEALATGTPVITSRLGILIESIKDGYNGLHFTAGDADDLRKKVELFLQHDEKGSDYYKNARQTYLEKYHPDVHYNAIIKIYQNAIDSNARKI